MKRKIFSLSDLNKLAQDIDNYNKLSNEDKIEKKDEILNVFSNILILRENSNLLDYNNNYYYDDRYCYDKELQFIPNDIQKKYVEDVLYFLSKTGYAGFEYLDNSIKLENFEICKNAYLKNDKNIDFIPKEIINMCPELFAFDKINDEEKRKNLNLCQRAVDLQPKNLKYIPIDVMKSNVEICINAVKKNSNCIKYIPNEVLMKNPSLYIEVLKKNSDYINYIPEEMLKNNPELYEISGWNFASLPDSLKRDENYLIIAAEKDYTSIKAICDWFECDYYAEECSNYDLSEYYNVFKTAIENNINAISYFSDCDILLNIEGIEDILVKALNDRDMIWYFINNSFYNAIDELCNKIHSNDNDSYKKIFENEKFIKELYLYLLKNDNILDKYKDILQFIPYKFQNKNLALKAKITEKIGNGYFYYNKNDLRYNLYNFEYDYGYDYSNIIRDIIIEKKEDFIDIFKYDIKYIISYIPSDILKNHLDLIEELINYILNDEKALKWHKNILEYIPYDIQNEFIDLIFKLYKKVGKEHVFSLSEKVVDKYEEYLINDYIDMCIEDWHNLLNVFSSSSSISIEQQQQITSKVLNYLIDNKKLSSDDIYFLESIPSDVQDKNEESILKIYNLLKIYDSKVFFDLSDGIKEKNHNICFEFCKDNITLAESYLDIKIFSKIAPKLLEYYIDNSDNFKDMYNQVKLLLHIPSQIQNNNEKLVLTLYHKIGKSHFQYLSKEIKDKYPDLYLEACKYNIDFFDYDKIFEKQKYYSEKKIKDEELLDFMKKYVCINDDRYNELEFALKKDNIGLEEYQKIEKEVNKQKEIAKELLIYFSKNEEALFKNNIILRKIPSIVQDENEDIVIIIYQKLCKKFGEKFDYDFLSNEIKKKVF